MVVTFALVIIQLHVVLDKNETTIHNTTVTPITFSIDNK